MTNSTLPRTRQLVITECVCVQLCPTLHDPVDCSPPVSFIRGIFQAEILEWVVISSSRGSSPLRDRNGVS